MEDLEQLQAEFFAFVAVAIPTIGVPATIQILNTLTGLITDEPAMARKLSEPATQQKLTDLSKQLKGKKIGPMEMFGLLPQVREIFE